MRSEIFRSTLMMERSALGKENTAHCGFRQTRSVNSSNTNCAIHNGSAHAWHRPWPPFIQGHFFVTNDK